MASLSDLGAEVALFLDRAKSLVAIMVALGVGSWLVTTAEIDDPIRAVIAAGITVLAVLATVVNPARSSGRVPGGGSRCSSHRCAGGHPERPRCLGLRRPVRGVPMSAPPGSDASSREHERAFRSDRPGARSACRSPQQAHRCAAASGGVGCSTLAADVAACSPGARREGAPIDARCESGSRVAEGSSVERSPASEHGPVRSRHGVSSSLR